jgi:hypothetical protein
MNKVDPSRREFLKLGAVGLGALALSPYTNFTSSILKPKYMLVGKKEGVSIHKLATDKSLIMYQRAFNDIINTYYDVIGEDGPEYNPSWYRVWGGYVHSANLTEVKYITNPIQSSVKEGGQLAEVTMPFTRSMLFSRYEGWQEMYRFYYGSVHWIIDIIEGPDKNPWYKVKDELGGTELAVPCQQLRYIPNEELTPISADVSASSKRIEISLYFQTLKAFEGDNLVLDTKISSGIPNKITQTPLGKYYVQTKMPSKHMGDGKLTSDIYAYELLGVPWDCFFQMEDGIATHGTYWHNNFGSPMSRGCVNMRIHEAKWLYRWTTPVASPDDWAKHGYGTPVIVS